MTEIRRFYETVAVAACEGGWHIHLDGRPVRTPARRLLALPTRSLADAVAAEWAAQSATVRPSDMPLTQFASTAIDRVATQRERVVDEIAGFAATDLLCHRATSPATLAARQHVHWQPLLDWAAHRLGAPMTATEGVIACAQPPASLAAIRSAVAAHDDFQLAALHVVTSLSGSVIVALAVALGEIDADTGWTVGQLDEDWQIAQWGEDPAAAERRRRLKADFDAAVRFLGLL